MRGCRIHEALLSSDGFINLDLVPSSMDTGTLRTLKDEYPTSSWALWSPEFPDDGCAEEDSTALYEFITRNRDRLRPSVVLLSLNPSTELPEDYRNFHSTDPKHRNDQFRDLVEEAGLEGAYMTDLVERVIDHESENVEPTPADVDTLLEQLELLDRERYHIICFHEKVFQALLEASDSAPRELPHDIRAFSCTEDGRRIDCYRVWFHANWGANKEKIPALREQLAFIQSEVADGGITDLSRWSE